jgi:hypothetical protein
MVIELLGRESEGIMDRWYHKATPDGLLEIGPVLRADYEAAEAQHLGSDLGWFLIYHHKHGREVLAKFVGEEEMERAVQEMGFELYAVADK